jgi:hypothetical protein
MLNDIRIEPSHLRRGLAPDRCKGIADDHLRFLNDATQMVPAGEAVK